MSLVFAGVVASTGCGDDVHALLDGSSHDGNGDATPPLPASLAISPLTSDYGSITVGQTSTATTFTITNTGPSASDNVQVAIQGTTTDFHITANTCQTLAPAATCTVGVTFSPTAAGVRNASVHAAVTGSVTSASISGTGANPGDLAVAPATTPFGDVQVGQTSTMVATIVVTNTGTAATGSLTVQATGSDPGQFTKTSDTCNGQTLAGGATCMITANFKPTSAGPKSAAFTIIGNPGGTVSSVVTGNGFTPAQLVVIPTAQAFGSVVVGSTSANVTLSVANSGGQATGAITAAVSGANAADFAIVTNTCTSALAPLATCNVTMRFTPGAVGAETATLTVSGTPGGSATSTLTGSGIAAGALAISPSVQAFPDTLVGNASAASTFTVTNNGGTSTGPIATSLTGGSANQFVVTNDTCATQPLAASAACTVTVTFNPTSAGAKAATLVVAGSPGGSVTAALSGNAIPAGQLSISPVSNDFGTVGVGGQSGFATFTVSNTGGTPTGVPTVTLGGSAPGQFNSVNNCSAAIAPLGTCTIMVQFKPTQTGLQSASITVVAAPGGTVSASVFGEGGQPAQLAVLPSSLAFTGTIGDTSPTQSFTVQNQGNSTTGTITITPGGANPGDFTESDTCGTLAAGATCTVTIAFAPTLVGSRAATMAVSASPGGSATVALTGIAVPRLEIISVGGGAPVDPYDFLTQTLNTSTKVTIVVRNNTSNDQILGELPAFPVPAQFSSANACVGVSIGHNGGTCSETVTFTPTAAGPQAGSLTFSIGAGAANQATQNLKGAGKDSIVWKARTTTDFGNIVVGQTSGVLLFDLTNLSATPATSLVISGPTAPFTIASNNCGASLGGNATCTVGLTFSPVTPALAQTTLLATAVSGGNPSIDVHGTGVSATDLNLNPAPTLFGNVFAGTHKDITVVVTNPAGAIAAGAMTFTLTGSSATFAPAPAFTILNDGSVGDCVSGTTALPNGQTCNIRIRFAPSTFDTSGTALKTGLLTVTATPGTPVGGVTSSLSGTSVSTISITPTPFDFGTLHSGANATQVFSVHNDSPASVVFPAGEAVFGGLCSQPSSVPTTVPCSTTLSITSDTCSAQTLLANATCQVTVKFAPTVQINNAATLTVLTTDTFGRGIAAIAAIGDNRTPTDVLLSNSTIAENQSNGTVVGALSAIDPDIGQTFTFTLPASTPDNANFKIVGTSLQQNVSAGFFNFEAQPSYSIIVRVTDQDGAFFDKAFVITIDNVDDPPVAVADSAIVDEDTLTQIDVMLNDTDEDAGPRQVASVSQSIHGGTVTITGGGTGVSYKPAANFCTTLASAQFATDTFTYTLSPAAVAPLNPASSTATVTVTVNCVDDNPVAVADTFTGANAATEDTAKILTVLTNDTDVDCAPFAGGLCGPIKITNVTQPANGTVQISVGQDTLTYTPNANYCNGDNPAMESFMYTLNGGSTTIVSVGVVCVNDPPQFTKGADQTVLEDAGAQTVVGWATNISAGPNEPGQTVVFQVIGDSNPTLFTSLPAVGPTGTLTYTPAADANGIAVITIRAQDNGGGNDTSSPQTFQITVTPVNDAPSFTGGGPVSSTGITPFSAGWATAFSAGPANESGQAVAHYNLALSSTTGNLGFAAGPAIDVAGNLTYTPTEGTNGSATYAVTVTDNGGTANGGVDTSAAQTLVITVGKATQTVAITSFPPANAAVNSTYVVTATATSGLAVSLSIDASTASNCSISGSTVTFLSANPCTIDANQAGDGSWFAAPQAQQTVGVGQAGQTITFTSTAPGAAVVNGATYTATATATSGLTVNITVDATSSTVCSIAGAVVSFIGAGTCTLDANQSGNANFNPAPQVQQSFAVAKGNQTIAFTSTAPVGETVGGPTYSVSATATSNLPVTITIDAASASI